MKSSTLRVITIVIAIIGLIGGVILGSVFKTVETTGYYYTRTVEHFNVTYMLVVWISTALYVVPCLALSRVLENQEEIMYTQRQQNKIVNTLANPDASNSKLNLSAVSSGKSSDSAWTCPDCGETNPRNIRICKSCGHEK